MVNKLVEAINRDCDKLMQNFIDGNNTEFSSFCDEYKKMQFYHIYTIQFSEADMIVTTRHIFNYCKMYFDNTKIYAVMNKIGALYMMYCTYYKQPQKYFVKIRVDMKTYKAIYEFIESISKQKLHQTRYIFYHLLKIGAFRFVFSDVCYGLEVAFNKGNDFTHSAQSANVDREEEFFKPEIMKMKDKKNGIFTAFKLLETEYNKCKSVINSRESVETKKIAVTSIVREYESQLDEFAKLLNIEKVSKEEHDASNNQVATESGRQRDVKQKAFKKNRNQVRKKILQDNLTDESNTDSEKEANYTPNIKRRRHTNHNFLNEPLPEELSKEVGKN